MSTTFQKTPQDRQQTLLISGKISGRPAQEPVAKVKTTEYHENSAQIDLNENVFF